MSPPTILFAYEFGSGLGHLNRLIAIAREVADRARCVFAVPDLALATPILEKKLPPHELQQGVFWSAPQDAGARRVPTHTLADVLTLFQFGEANMMGAKLDGWRRLLDDIRPDLIVSDFAPTLRAASWGLVPTVVVGNGYTVPVQNAEFPPLRPWQDAVPAASRDAEQRILADVNLTRRAGGQAPFEYLPDLFGGERSFVCTITEFDPYARYRSAPVTWPFNVPVVRSGPPSHRRTGPEIFVYMAASHALFDLLLSALNRLGRATRLYVPDQDARIVAQRCRRHVGVLTQPADFAAVLPETRLLIHHAGLGTAYTGLVAGTPQLVLPLNLEHLITARSLIDFGVAHGFSANTPLTQEQLENAIASLLADDRMGDDARRVAGTVNARRVANPTAAVVEACGAYLDRGV